MTTTDEVNKRGWSECCSSSVRLYSGKEGTNHYICNSCDKACDVVYPEMGERTPDPALASPESLELEKIINKFFDRADQLNERSDYTYQDCLKEALQAITALHDAEIEYVIGEDEVFEKPIHQRRTYAEIARYARQALKNEQRKRWEERK